MSESIDERYQQFMTVPIGKYIGTTTLVYDMHAEIARLRREKAELVAAMHEMLHHFGKPRREEYLNATSYVMALQAVDIANFVLHSATETKGEPT